MNRSEPIKEISSAEQTVIVDGGMRGKMDDGFK
jgi:hypothetical protein